MGHGSWYIDEDDQTLVRWHDGTGWTDYVLVRADWDGADGPPPPPDDPVWATPRGPVLRFAAGTAAVVLLVIVGALAVFGDGGSDDDPAGGSTIGRQAPDEDRSTADDLTSLGSFGADAELGSEPSTDGELDDVAGSDGGTTRTTRRSGSGTTPTTRGSAVQRTEFRSETHTDGGSREVIGPRDDVQLGNSSATTIASNYTPPPSTAPPSTVADTTTTTAAPPPTSDTTGGATTG